MKKQNIGGTILISCIILAIFNDWIFLYYYPLYNLLCSIISGILIIAFIIGLRLYKSSNKAFKPKKGVLYLPEKWQQILLRIPESGHGFKIVNIELENGEILTHQIILDDMYPKGSITAEQITQIKDIKLTKL